jgi:DNA-binding response OmpR family regulator
MSEEPKIPTPATPPKNVGAGKKILVIDDDPSSLELLRGVLTNTGFEVLVAADGQAGWMQMTPQKMPNLIIADIVMPQMDGFQLFKELKKNQETQQIPILIISARKNMQDSFLAMGADAFIEKPINTETLLAQAVALSSRKAIATKTSLEPQEKKQEEKGGKEKDKKEKK